MELDAEIKAEFIQVFGPLAQKELDSLMKEAIYRTQRLCNKNTEGSKKVLTSNKSFDTV